MIVWQLTQYPEAGAYRFMPGLLNAALSNPRAVDEFLSARAGGDVARKREMWSKMIADPSGSAELKALLFASQRVALYSSSPWREALARFGLAPTAVEPGYVSVRPIEENRVVLYTNFDLPG